MTMMATMTSSYSWFSSKWLGMVNAEWEAKIMELVEALDTYIPEPVACY